MNIAIFGASSYLARDLIVSFSRQNNSTLDLYGRSVDQINDWLTVNSLETTYTALSYSAFNANLHYDAIINFVGIGDPAHALSMGASIFEITRQYDELALDYLKKHSNTKYIFLSSGAVYGHAFSEPVNENTPAFIDINHLVPTDFYGLAKLHAEAKHRCLIDFNIVDLRVFNYFSSTIDQQSRFFISDALRSVRRDEVLQTSTGNMYRDYLHPDDLYQLIHCALVTQNINQAMDCYTQAPIDKMTLLEELKTHFGLKYVCVASETTYGVNATGLKDHYYSLNKRAALIGYQPTRTSLACVIDGFRQLALG